MQKKGRVEKVSEFRIEISEGRYFCSHLGAFFYMRMRTPVYVFV